MTTKESNKETLFKEIITLISKLVIEIDNLIELHENEIILELVNVIQIIKEITYNDLEREIQKIEYLKEKLIIAIETFCGYSPFKKYCENIFFSLFNFTLLIDFQNPSNENNNLKIEAYKIQKEFSTDIFTINNSPIIFINKYNFFKLKDFFISQSVNFNYSEIEFIVKCFNNLELDNDVSYIIYDENTITRKLNESIASSLFSYMNLHKISRGDIIHKSIECSHKTIFPGNIENFVIDRYYQQFDEIITIFSEYNESKNYLDKFFKLYSILENLMIRNQICSLLSSGLNIRKFKILYKNTIDNELKTLQTLFQSAFDQKHTINPIYNKNSDYIKDLLKQYESTFWKPSTNEKACFDNFFTKIEVEPIKSVIDSKELCQRYSKVVYAIRNSIVHNKETEYHITSANENEFIQSKIAEFFMISIEILILSLITKKNTNVWYERKTLELF